MIRVTDEDIQAAPMGTVFCVAGPLSREDATMAPVIKLHDGDYLTTGLQGTIDFEQIAEMRDEAHPNSGNLWLLLRWGNDGSTPVEEPLEE